MGLVSIIYHNHLHLLLLPLLLFSFLISFIPVFLLSFVFIIFYFLPFFLVQFFSFSFAFLFPFISLRSSYLAFFWLLLFFGFLFAAAFFIPNQFLICLSDLFVYFVLFLAFLRDDGDLNALGLLPDKMRAELALHVNLKTLKKVTHMLPFLEIWN